MLAAALRSGHRAGRFVSNNTSCLGQQTKVMSDNIGSLEDGTTASGSALVLGGPAFWNCNLLMQHLMKLYQVPDCQVR